MYDIVVCGIFHRIVQSEMNVNIKINKTGLIIIINKLNNNNKSLCSVTEAIDRVDFNRQNNKIIVIKYL